MDLTEDIKILNETKIRGDSGVVWRPLQGLKIITGDVEEKKRILKNALIDVYDPDAFLAQMQVLAVSANEKHLTRDDIFFLPDDEAFAEWAHNSVNYVQRIDTGAFWHANPPMANLMNLVLRSQGVTSLHVEIDLNYAKNAAITTKTEILRHLNLGANYVITDGKTRISEDEIQRAKPVGVNFGQKPGRAESDQLVNAGVLFNLVKNTNYNAPINGWENVFFRTLGSVFHLPEEDADDYLMDAFRFVVKAKEKPKQQL